MSQSTQPVPWQFEWKRPQWQTLTGKDEALDISGSPIATSSALVLPHELPPELVEKLELEEDSCSSLLLTVTLFSTTRRDMADVVLLELLHKTQSLSEVKRVHHRVLQWPASLQPSRSNWRFWHKGKARGLVGACLCRRLLAANSGNPVVAMDAVQFLALGLDGDMEGLTDTPNQKDSYEEEKTTELLLACLSSDGRLHIYSPKTLLEQHVETIEVDHDLAMTAFLLGSNVYERIKESILPLSNPMESIFLTVPLKRPSDEIETQGKDTPSRGTVQRQDSSSKVSLWENSIWDSTVDPETAIYCTKENILSLCVFAYDYVVVAGRGTPVHKQNPNDQGHSQHNQAIQDWWNREEEARDGTSHPSEASVNATSEKGGFVTFVSLALLSETRTIFLPFAPNRITPFTWGGMKYVLVIGEKAEAVAIRTDSSTEASSALTVPSGEAPSIRQASKDSREQDRTEAKLNDLPGSPSEGGSMSVESKRSCRVRRFQVLPILLPQDERGSSLVDLVGSGSLTSPPVLVAVHADNAGALTLAQRTMHSVKLVERGAIGPIFREYRRKTDKSIVAIETVQQDGHVARVSIPNGVSLSLEEFRRLCWIFPGQGWCLVGAGKHVDFVCWEGATALRGACVCEIASESSDAFALGIPSHVLPTRLITAEESSRLMEAEESNRRRLSPDLQLPFTSAYSLSEIIGEEDEVGEIREPLEGGDEIVVDALESISSLNFREQSSVPSSPHRRSRAFSHREKSARLVRQCSSWTQLTDTETGRIRLEGQVPVVSVYAGRGPSTHFLLTMRKVVVENGAASPFQQVLSWLSHRKDYFTAASVALDLLHDAETLRHLWRAVDRIDEENEQTKLEGLLDGVIPIFPQVSDGFGEVCPRQSTMTQLSDMTVGCLTKGGFAMSSTLGYFLQNNLDYSPARACLMLGATATNSVSDDEEMVASVMGQGYERGENHFDNILWPVRCLLRIGVARDYLSTGLVLLNVTIPDELRGRRRQDSPSVKAPSKDLSVSLVTLVLESSDDAPELLLGLVDEDSRSRYWQSLQHDIQLLIALINIDGKYPMLRQGEVRGWARENLNKCLENEDLVSALNLLSTTWLQELCTACIRNADCDIQDLCRSNFVDGYNDDEFERSSDKEFEDDDGVDQHIEELKTTRNALVAAPRSGGVDFDLLIPSLLLLEHREVQWRDDASVSTQSLLDAACFLAGRHNKEETWFLFDSSTVMRQCALAGNVGAGANLVGGTNGLVLKCCNLLIQNAGMSMENAEAFLVDDFLSLDAIGKGDGAGETEFQLNDGHRHLLWLLDEYVIRVRTYGEFGATKTRGSVDPIFAAQSCLRTWLALTVYDVEAGSSWLVSWLRRRLGIGDGTISRKRLACAALNRALIWTLDDVKEPSPDQVLASALKVESKFLVQLAQSCCGLVASVPRAVAEELLQKADSSGDREIIV